MKDVPPTYLLDYLLTKYNDYKCNYIMLFKKTTEILKEKILMYVAFGPVP